MVWRGTQRGGVRRVAELAELVKQEQQVSEKAPIGAFFVCELTNDQARGWFEFRALDLDALLLGDYGVGKKAQAFYGNGDGFAVAEPALGSAPITDAGRRASGYDVAG